MEVLGYWVGIYIYHSKNVKYGNGPKSSNPTVDNSKPDIIIDQWFCILSEIQPQPGLENPYNAENSKNIRPICSGVKLN